jgi:hypothetical protein
VISGRRHGGSGREVDDDVEAWQHRLQIIANHDTHFLANRRATGSVNGGHELGTRCGLKRFHQLGAHATASANYSCFLAHDFVWRSGEMRGAARFSLSPLHLIFTRSGATADLAGQCRM